MEKQPRPALLPEVPFALRETGKALGLWQPRPSCSPPSARWDSPPPAAWGSCIPAQRLGWAASPRRPSLSPLTSLLPYWGSCTQNRTRGRDEQPHGAHGPGEAGRWWARLGLGLPGPPGVSGAPPPTEKSRLCHRESCHVAADKDRRRATCTDVPHPSPAASELKGTRGLSGSPLDKKLALLAAAQRHGSPGSRPSPPRGRTPKQFHPFVFLREKVQSFLQWTFMKELHFPS